MKFHEKLEKLSFMFFSQIQLLKDVWKSVEISLFLDIKVVWLRNLNPDRDVALNFVEKNFLRIFSFG